MTRGIPPLRNGEGKIRFSTPNDRLITVDAASVRSGVALFMPVADQNGHMRPTLAGAVGVKAPSAGALATDDLTRSLLRASAAGNAMSAAAVGLLRAQSRTWRTERVHAIVEFPKVYKTGPGARVPSDNVLVLAASATACVEALVSTLGPILPVLTIEVIRPQDWKGQASKTAMCEHIVERLTPEELWRVEDPSDDNILDAIGIGQSKLLI
jgi:hypothetical protein